MSPAEESPYLYALKAYAAKEILAFQVPGHRGGKGASLVLREFLGDDSLRADLTEVLGVDDLHRPLGQCGCAQRLAAETFGADATHFLINGSTCGVQAMLLATLGPGETVLVPRNAHRSLWGGLMLCGATAAIYCPNFDSKLGVFAAATPEVILKAIDKTPQAKAVFLTSPTYHGHVSDTRAITKLAHDKGLLVLVDEAWGAHLAFHPQLPESALSGGADLVVQSTHKMLSSLTQSAMLHVKGQRVDRARLDLVLRTLQSSSPSALLVASLDAACQHYRLHGQELLKLALAAASQAACEINEIAGASCIGGVLGQLGWDPLHLFVRLDGYTGYQLEEALFKLNIAVELAEPSGVLLIFSSSQGADEVEALVSALKNISKAVRAGKKSDSLDDLFSFDPRMFLEAKLVSRDALFSPSELVPWQSAIGLRSAETVTIYPPGIPWLLPGEVIDLRVIEAMRARLRAGARVQGASDLSLEQIRVVS